MIFGLLGEAVGGGARAKRVCAELGIARRTLERWQGQAGGDRRAGPKSVPRNRLSVAERDRLLAIANSEEFRDLSPKQIVPRLADRGMYIASERTLYRLLRERGQLAHRSAARPPRSRAKPRLKASAPKQVWCWDITYLRTPIRGVFVYLYLVVDLFSREIVAARVHDRECSTLAAQLIEAACQREGVVKQPLILHADNGSAMKGATLKVKLEQLGVIASYSRPSVSDDNPYIESLFRTLKYRPDFPDGAFASVATAQLWVDRFVAWYNTEHRHSGIRFVTPEQRHRGLDREILAQRARVWQAAQRRHPERWSGKLRDWARQEIVYLNSPEETHAALGAA
jgi:transposase InsO family protein